MHIPTASEYALGNIIVSPIRIAENSKTGISRIPDEITPERVMSIDLKGTDVYAFFSMLLEAYAKKVLVFKNLTGTIDKYQRVDFPYQQILQELAKKQGLVVHNKLI